MKKKLVYSFLIFSAIVLQTSVLPVIFPSGLFGDIVLMLVLAGAVLDGFFDFFWWAVFAGVIYDLVSYEKVGVHALIFLLLVYFVSFFSRRFSVEFRGVGILLFGVFVLVGSLISKIVISFVISWDMQTFQKFFGLLGGPREMLIELLFNVVLFLLCFFVLKKSKNFFEIGI